MKSIKRCAKLGNKYDDLSMQSHDREGMYYQFLIERKVANGVLRHIASNEEVVTYEFIPNNYVSKRRKLKESLEPNSELLQTTKEEVKEGDSHHSNKFNLNGHQSTNFNTKSDDNKVSLKARNKDSRRAIKNQIRSNLNLDYNKPCMLYKRPSANVKRPVISDVPLMKKSVSHCPKDLNPPMERSSKSRAANNLKLQTKHFVTSKAESQQCYQKCSDPHCNAKAKYFITYASKGAVKVSGPQRKPGQCSLKRSKSNPFQPVKVKRNPNIKYIKADALRKYEKLRDQQFEQQISELMGTKNDDQKLDGSSFKENRDSNIEHFSIENLSDIESLNDKTESEDTPKPTDEVIIAQNYGSFDDEEGISDELSKYSYMKDDSIAGDFDLEVVGTKIEAPKPFDPYNLDEDADKLNNVSALGFKKTFGEPSGDVFGLTFNPECTGIFKDDVDYEFQPVNTIDDNKY